MYYCASTVSLLSIITERLERLTAALLAASIVLGSLLLWIGIPVGGLWVAGELTTSTQAFLFAALGGVPLAMVAAGWLLYLLGARYEGLRDRGYGEPRARSSWLVAQSDESASSRRARGRSSLVDVCMAASATLALGLLLFWFFFAAEMKLAPMQ